MDATMNPRQWMLLALNMAGGLAVLGSYAQGFATAPDPAALWGGVPLWLRPAYTVSMWTAALGYFPVLLYVLRLDAARTRVGPFGFGLFALCYAAILLPSALWMPLTFRHVAFPSLPLWIAIRVVLGFVALGSLGLLAALVAARPRPGSTALRGAAIAGQVAFCLQTVALDALVWPAYWPAAG
jgi:hypothetical protein